MAKLEYEVDIIVKYTLSFKVFRLFLWVPDILRKYLINAFNEKVMIKMYDRNLLIKQLKLKDIL